MPIQILSARLANQIAAGEVVERPASVVKELVENSIDAGATLIEIDIEKGGSKLIRIRDNGSGIEKQELTLALSRHATSKIANLDDLEAIVSLGFRGEALASISSVSRLTLTSRTQAQTEAWCAYAEGRDMSVQIKPAAHPVGTTVDVVDLFFNTPARRKFLRTDKTEFNHIDELVKRIALSRFDITLVLRHNGNLVRQYRAATTDAQREKRLSSICGTAFVKSAVKIELHHHDVSLTGWICSPAGARKQNDVQYCFVNQRMMKDKLINHAIRQGYESLLRSEQYAAFVLFIHVDPHQVDVNVHPAKHEVRFHQSRFIHDFIYQAVADALYQLGESSKLTAQCYDLAHANVNNQSGVSFVTSHAEPRSDSLNHRRDSSLPAVKESTIGYHQAKIPEKRSHSHYSQRTLSSKSYQGLYQSLMTTTDEIPDNTSSSEMSIPETSASHLQEWETQPSMLGNPLAIVEQKYLLLQQGNALFLLKLRQAEFLQRLGQLHLVVADDKVKTLPLLIPQTFSVSQEEWRCVEAQQHLLQDFGIVIKKKSEQKIILMAICSVLRHKNMQEFISAMIDYLKIKKESAISKDEFARWLADFATPREITYSLVKATTLVSSLEYQWKEKLTTYQDTLLRPLDVAVAIEAFKA